jgi:signal transduction histidine kinase
VHARRVRSSECGVKPPPQPPLGKGGIEEGVVSELDADYIEISVEDTGIGISAGDREKLFQPFSRIVSPDRLTVPGTGLGLYLTRKIACDILRGEILVSSKEGEGSVFMIRIPEKLG